VKFAPGAVANLVQAEVLGIGMFPVQKSGGQPGFVGY
jgi:hypothetical protein